MKCPKRSPKGSLSHNGSKNVSALNQVRLYTDIIDIYIALLLVGLSLLNFDGPGLHISNFCEHCEHTCDHIYTYRNIRNVVYNAEKLINM